MSPGVPMVDMLALESVRPNPKQPRQHFDDQSLQSLAASIRSAGVMQPIVVRPRGLEGGFEIIAGERRWRAARMAGLERIPAVVREVDDRTAAEWSLVENLQREDLNPMERAEAFQQLIDRFGLTHQEIAERVGLDRSSVTNHLRLNELDEQTKQALKSGALGMGHARALLAITNITRRAAFAAAAVREAWSVRETERRVRELGLREGGSAGTGGAGGGAEAGDAGSIAAKKGPAVHPHMADLQRKLGEHLGTKVRVEPGKTKGAGRLIIDFYNLDQFEGLMKRLDFVMD